MQDDGAPQSGAAHAANVSRMSCRLFMNRTGMSKGMPAFSGLFEHTESSLPCSTLVESTSKTAEEGMDRVDAAPVAEAPAAWALAFFAWASEPPLSLQSACSLLPPQNPVRSGGRRERCEGWREGRRERCEGRWACRRPVHDGGDGGKHS